MDFLRSLFGRKSNARTGRRAPKALSKQASNAHRPEFDILEDRCLPSGTTVSSAAIQYTSTNSQTCDSGTNTTTVVANTGTQTCSTNGSIPTILTTTNSQTCTTSGATPTLTSTVTEEGGGCYTISGYDYYDANNDGLMDDGEQGIANTPIELLNSQNVVVGTTVTDANGYYQFTKDATISTTPQSLPKTIDFQTAQTDYSTTGQVSQFNPTLGTLQSITIADGGSITSDIRVENTSTNSPSTITANVSGILTLTGPNGLTVAANVSQNAGTYNATAFDGTIDFAGTSGDDLGDHSATGYQSVNLTGSEMAAFIGTGTIELTQSAQATSTANGGGNVIIDVSSTATAQVVVTYNYIPSNCLRPGNYTIVKTAEPAAYTGGQESSNGVVLDNPPNDYVIPVTLTNSNLPNNNFGELKVAGLSGYVYADVSNGGYNDGIMQPNEAGIGGVTITLTGHNANGTVNQTTTTNNSGLYQFENLLPGEYTVTETHPNGWIDGKDTVGSAGGNVSQDQISNINLPAGDDATSYNFGEIQVAQISGTVYYDGSSAGYNNGVQDPGEPGIPGVTVNLTGTDINGNAVSQTAVTDQNGHYAFNTLVPGTYSVADVQPTPYTAGKNTLGNDGGQLAGGGFAGIVLSVNSNAQNYNFGEILPPSISGYVYADISNGGYNDGIMEPDEAGIGGVIITLSGTSVNGAVNQTTTTNNSGFYQFQNLAPGNYTLTETHPANWIDGKDTVGSAGGNSSQDQFSEIYLPADTAATNYNFGEILVAQVSGTVYFDGSAAGYNNGVQDPGEPGIPGVTINLAGTDINGNTVSQTTQTDQSGHYNFNNLAPGTYSVVDVQPTAYTAGKDTLGNHGGQLANGGFSGIVLAGDDAALNYNFGELLQPSVSGYVYSDTSAGGYNDGIMESNEAGIGGVIITLSGSNANGAVNQTTTTNNSGFYQFKNLLPGNYTITETHPSGWIDGKDTVGSAGGNASQDQFSNINLTAGTAATNYNFAEIQVAQISGTVYYDGSATGYDNGVQDTGEPGIPNVTINLTGTDINGSAVSQTAQTDQNGHYAFSNLAPGTYSVSDVQPSAYLPGKNTLGNDGGQLASGGFSGIVVAVNGAAAKYNFGELLPSSISGFVYLDTSPSGYDDGIKEANEQGIGGVTITLTGTNDQGTVLNLQTTTDSTGAYSFTGLRPGTYTVTETSPAGYIDSKDTLGTIQTGQVGKDVLSNIVLPPNVNDANNNFGELTPSVQVFLVPPITGIVPNPPSLTPPVLQITNKTELIVEGEPGGAAILQSDANFVNSLYTSILGHTADTNSLAAGVTYLITAGTRQALFQSIWNSTEHRTDEVNSLSQAILGAAPTQAALSTYLSMFSSGNSEFQVAAAIAGSAQATALYPSIGAFINEVYTVALGRTPTPTELATWQAFTGSRTALAFDIFTSTEGLTDVIQSCYSNLLNRAPSSAETANGIALIQASSSGYATMLQNIYMSSEYAALIG